MKLFIYGAHGAGVEVYDLANRVNKNIQRYSEIFFIDDFQEETEFYGTKRIHFDSCANYIDDEAEFIIAVGEPSSRKLLADKIAKNGYKLGTLIDPSVLVSDTASIAEGCIVNAGSIISSLATLEKNCMLGYQTIVGHHAVLKQNCVVCPMSTIGGNSTVGYNTFIGLNSSMKEGVILGDNVIVGMGSMMFRDVPDGCTVVGNPARITKGNDSGKVFRKGE